MHHSNLLQCTIQSWHMFRTMHYPKEYEINKSLQSFEKLISNQLLEKDDQNALLSNVILDCKKYRKLLLQHEPHHELDLCIARFESFVCANAK